MNFSSIGANIWSCSVLLRFVHAVTVPGGSSGPWPCCVWKHSCIAVIPYLGLLQSHFLSPQSLFMCQCMYVHTHESVCMSIHVLVNEDINRS